jgi:glutamate dehydrogenase (NADP+)
VRWTREEVDAKLKLIMQHIHASCVKYGSETDTKGNRKVDYINGANIAGFVRVADAMIDQGML